MVILFGILFHYILPQLRKQLPWLLFSEPLIKQADYSLFEPTGETKAFLSLTAQLLRRCCRSDESSLD